MKEHLTRLAATVSLSSLPCGVLAQDDAAIYPQEPAVYVILNMDTESVVYVGQTFRLRQRLTYHRRRFKGCKVVWLLSNGYTPFQRWFLEALLIRRFRPVHNKYFNSKVRKYDDRVWPFRATDEQICTLGGVGTAIR